MSTEWYCKIGDRQFGPVPTQKLRDMAVGGQLTPSSMVRRGENGQWVPADRVKGLEFSNSKISRTANSPSDDLPKASTPKPPTPKPPTAKPPVKRSATPVYSTQPSPAPVPSQQPTPVYQQSNSARAPFVDTKTSEPLNQGLNAAVKWAIGIGVCLAVGLIAILVVMKANDDQPTRPPVAKNVNHPDPEKPAFDPESEPSDQPKQEKESSPKRPQTHPAITSISRWRTMLTGARLLNRQTSEEVVVWVTDAWFGANAKATTQPPKTVNSDRPDNVFDAKALGLDPNKQRTSVTGRILEPAGANTNVPPSDSSEKPRYVLVRVKITNKSADQALHYAGFNRGDPSSKSLAAMLFDDLGTRCKLVGTAEVNSEARLTETEIASGETAYDLLVFELPPATFKHLKLLLPRAAIGMESGQDFIGFQIAKDDVIGSGSKHVERQKPTSVGEPKSKPQQTVENAPRSQPTAPPVKPVNSGKKAFDALQRSIGKEE